MFYRYLLLFLFTPTFLTTADEWKTSKIKTKTMDPRHDYEVSALGEIRINKKIKDSKLKSCIPRESQVFPKSFSQEQKESLFRKSEFEDLQNCNPKKCAFNFFPPERRLLEQNAKNSEKLKELYFDFYQNRVKGITPLDPKRAKNFIRSDQDVFGLCKDPKINELIDQRPLASVPIKLSHVHYESKMRPTTRLVQGRWIKTKNQLCYAEALLFADHYDVDRVEVWAIDRLTDDPDYQTRIRLEVRHRIDLLNSWIRRLNKPAFYKSLKEIISKQLVDTAECLK